MRVKLVEAFSETMPSWLRTRLLYTAIYAKHPDNGYRRNKEYRKTEAEKRRVDITGQANPVQGKGVGTPYNLFQAFRDRGIDLNSAVFHEIEVPTSIKSPYLKDPYIPIFLLSNDVETQVYVRGINDSERALYGLHDSSYDKALKYIPNKDLLEHCIAFCYLDKNDPSTYKTFKTRDRIIAKSELPKNYNRTPKSNQWWDAEYDKSGYIRDPHKYENKLRELRSVNYKGDLDKCYKELQDIFEDIKNFWATADIDTPEEYRAARDTVGYFDAAKDKYDEILDAISRYDNDPDRLERYVKDRVYGKDGKGELDKLKSQIKVARDRVDEITNVVFDWED